MLWRRKIRIRKNNLKQIVSADEFVTLRCAEALEKENWKSLYYYKLSAQKGSLKGFCGLIRCLGKNCC
jgi:hypothetical protein